jgi:hypothetical protein
VDRRRQPPLIVMPDELTDLPEHVLNGVEGCCPIHFGFEPLPEALDWILFRGIWLQVLKSHPCMLLEKAFDGTAFVHLGIIEDHDEQCFGEALVELVQEGQKRLGCPPLGPFPVAALGPEMEGAKQRGALTLRRGGHFDLCACAKPPTLDIGFVGKM